MTDKDSQKRYIRCIKRLQAFGMKDPENPHNTLPTSHPLVQERIKELREYISLENKHVFIPLA